MICPLDHEDADYRFGKARIEESMVLRICPKCGIVFAPTVKEEGSRDEVEGDFLGGSEGEVPSEKQILKWP
jgi:hypothetical protein